MQFDARAAKLLAAGQHFTISDCPGLRLAATAQKRAWIYRYKNPDGLMRQTKIGEWPAMSPAAATVAWEKLRDARASGEDPGAIKRAARQQELADAVAERVRKSAITPTVGQVCEDYLVKHVQINRAPKGAAEVARMFRTMLATVADVPAHEVTRSVAFNLIESFSHIPVVASSLRGELGGAWDYALDAGRLPETVPNWWRLIMRGKLRSKGRVVQGESIGTAKRVLSADELGVLIPWLPNFTCLVEDALTMYLWTATRGAEIMAMEGCEITEEEDGLWWTLPKAKTKNSWREHATDLRVPLVGRAEVIVRRRRERYGQGYLFPASSRKGQHVDQKTIGVSVWMHMPYAKTRPEYLRPRLVIERWTPHDLRRTSRTLLAKLGCPDEIGEAIIGHMKPGIVGVYNLHAYDKERREWLTRLDPYLESLARP